MVVAVIDSGVNKMDGMLQEQDIEDIYYEDQEFKTCYVGKLNPHGTEIIKVLLKEAPDIKILSVRTLQADNRCMLSAIIHTKIAMYRIYIDDFWLIGDIIILKTKKEIKMKRITKSLPFKLLLGVCIGIIVGLLAGEGLMNIIVTVKYILGQYINFCVPLIVIGFIAPSIPKLGNNASKMLAVALVIAYVSSLGAAVFSVLTGNVIIPYLSIASSVGDLKVLPEVVFKLDIPQIMGVMSALVFSLLVGLAATWTRAVTVINLLDEFQEIVLKIVTNTVIPVLPVFIATTFCTLAYEGTITKQLPVFIQVVVIVMVGHYIWLAMLYLIAGAYAGRNPLEVT